MRDEGYDKRCAVPLTKTSSFIMVHSMFDHYGPPPRKPHHHLGKGNFQKKKSALISYCCIAVESTILKSGIAAAVGILLEASNALHVQESHRIFDGAVLLFSVPF